MAREKKVGIKRIRVEQLFGLYNYEIPSTGDEKDIATVLILYGENGSGKTTILRLIFHLLASQVMRGHKTYVSKVKFRGIEIELTNGVEIWAKRSGSHIIGSFEMGLRNKKEQVFTINWEVGPEGSIRVRSRKEDIEQNNFLSKLDELNLTIYLLSDDRTVQISAREQRAMAFYREELPQSQEGLFYEHRRRIPQRTPQLDPEEISLQLLTMSIENAQDWLRGQVMRGSSKGESDVNVIYSDIIRKIASPSTRGRPEKGVTREDLCERINGVEKRNREFSKFGLAPSFDGSKLEHQVSSATGRQFTLVRRILVPYLDGLEAKLNAVHEVRARIGALVSTLNSFLLDKTVNYHISKGFTIKSRTNEALSPRMLSSGEKHLLLLFCNTITALDKKSIFIIDEPEISLNVKWQRNLITSLIECARNSSVQYIFASHSMEILSQHMDKVVKLEHKAK